MAFLHDLGKKITDGVQDASKKTTELLEISKLNSAITVEKDAISAAKLLIGEKMYAQYNAGEAVPEVLLGDMQSIVEHLQKITDLEAKIAEIKTVAEAEKASKAAASSATQAAGAKKFCTGCGALLPEGIAFCSSCGKKVE